MNRYLILYGAENEMATFEADDIAHAIEQFCNWEPVAPDYETNRAAINEINLCVPQEL